MTDRNHSQGLFGRLGAGWTRFRRDRRANVAVIFALALVPFVGMLGMASEGSSWLLTQRAEQNAADSAVVAAATAGIAQTNVQLTNSTSGGTDYSAEGLGVAAKFGFANVSPVSVVVSNTATCPGGGTCYQVIITKTVPTSFTNLVTGRSSQSITASAMAKAVNAESGYCLLALDTANNADGILVNGGSKGNLYGCIEKSNSNVTCDGNNSTMNASEIIYANKNKNGKCLPNPGTTTPAMLDPYDYTNVANPNTYGAAYQVLQTNAASCPANSYSNTTTTLSVDPGGGTHVYCGNLSVSTTVMLASSSPTIIVIENGNLQGAGTLQTTGTGGATLIFTGTPSSNIGNLSNNGTINLSSPTTGTWSGVAIYDPVTPSLTYSGNQPTWDLSGLVYFPKANELLMSGIVDKSGSGYTCFVLVVDDVRFNGTAQIFANPLSQCGQQGLVAPSGDTGLRAELVE